MAISQNVHLTQTTSGGFDATLRKLQQDCKSFEGNCKALRNREADFSKWASTNLFKAMTDDAFLKELKQVKTQNERVTHVKVKAKVWENERDRYETTRKSLLATCEQLKTWCSAEDTNTKQELDEMSKKLQEAQGEWDDAHQRICRKQKAFGDYLHARVTLLTTQTTQA